MKAVATIYSTMRNTGGVVIALDGRRNSWLVAQKPNQAGMQEKII